MTNKLIEAMARALEYNPQRSGWVSYENDAQAVLKAISDTGYAVVPCEPSEAMWDAAMREGYDQDPATYYRAMINATTTEEI